MHAFRIPALLCLALAGCDRGDTPSRAPVAATTPGDATNGATATSNGITLRANVVETADLQESVAAGYGIAREPNQALLLLTVRDANGDNATPVSLQATVSDLKGGERPLPLREVRTGDFVDRIALVPIAAPDTLTFDIRAQLAPGSTSTVRLSRDFYPR
ncbi:DUF4426 domain-containing protein [Pseudoluteimonas lycopersici]|uniref:DUF4426 domain-containing protein n=1 Tax=Pseudoluteimonas lycopersici TaxID=1324796 RepID=A0A516V4V5_9GAMM|nr:DUF4426 domain-containing protein [Lysobacter lycopersici]QDQ73527.1 DUF4426 domain-containing protein [Lysobacter lycopersici]